MLELSNFHTIFRHFLWSSLLSYIFHISHGEQHALGALWVGVIEPAGVVLELSEIQGRC